MAIVALVTLLLLCQYIVFLGLVGKARAQGGVEAPAVSGDEIFERAVRVQMNTVEQLIITLPAMWICAYFYSENTAAGLGLAFFVGRLLYRIGYMKDPSKRGAGFLIGFLANIALVALGIWGAFNAV